MNLRSIKDTAHDFISSGFRNMAPAPFIGALFSRLSKCFCPSEGPESDLRHRLGSKGEQLAVRFLRRNKYRVLYRNFRARHGGEVDIIARDRTCNTLAFIEVKTRSNVDYGHPAEAVTPQKQKLISRGALEWLRMLGNPDIYFRFDIVEVLMDGPEPRFNLIKNAFPLSEPYRY